MTLTIELSPEHQQLLATMAQGEGQPLPAYASAFFAAALAAAAQQQAQEDAEDNAAAEAARRDYERNGGKPYSQFLEEIGLS